MNAAFGVSVVIPYRDAAATLRAAAESALSQPEAAEVLLVDDDSSDASPEVARVLSAEFPDRIRCLSTGAPRGPGAARNVGIGAARCEWIAFLDADDVYLPGRFEEVARLAAANPLADGVYEASERVVAPGCERLPHVRSRRGYRCFPAGLAPERVLENLSPLGRHAWDLNSITLRRRAFDKTGGAFPEDRANGEDTLLWLRLATCCRLVGGRLDRPVSRRVLRTGSLSALDPDPRATALGVLDAFAAWLVTRPGGPPPRISVAIRSARRRLSPSLFSRLLFPARGHGKSPCL